MIINKLKLSGFQLFKNAEINFGHINLITGINFDSPKNEEDDYTGNGAGKSQIQTAIAFVLYGEVNKINLSDLIRFGEKGCSVELEGEEDNKRIRIIRKIPSKLQIFIDDKEKKFNTPTIAQNYLNELLKEDKDKFRMYRMIDLKKGINLLDLTGLGLRKNLMDFINNQFIVIRQNLLNKKNEREKYSVDKKLYKFYLSTKRQTILEDGLKQLEQELITIKKDGKEQNNVLGNYQSEIRTKQNLIYNRKKEIENVQKSGMCPILKKKCQEITKTLTKEQKEKINLEVINWEKEINDFKTKLKEEESCMDYYNGLYESIQKHVENVRHCIMKLKEAQRFSEYKYTKTDIQLYADAIKTLDSFSAFYIMKYLNNLSIIINDLLKPVNISIEFNLDKEFIKVTESGRKMKYDLLSSGQQTFLNAVFKIGVLLNEGITSGLLLIDEGVNTIDPTNLPKFLSILRNLNFQSYIIYQGISKNLQDINYINIERKLNVSYIK